MTTTTDTLPRLEIVQDTIDIQQLGTVFDHLVEVGHGYNGFVRSECILDATVDEYGSRLTVLPYYLKADIHFLRADCYDAYSNSNQTYTLKGDYMGPYGPVSTGKWQFVDRPLSGTVVTPSEQMAQQFFAPVIDAWKALGPEEQQAYLRTMTNTDGQRTRSQGYIARLLGRADRH